MKSPRETLSIAIASFYLPSIVAPLILTSSIYSASDAIVPDPSLGHKTLIDTSLEMNGALSADDRF
jgi:hypothetical protein